jgi:hypothetical protein
MPGLIGLGYVLEANKVYTITEGGRQALKEDLQTPNLPELRDKEKCTNHRYSPAAPEA